MTVSRELSRSRLDLVGVQEVRWEGTGTKPAEEYTFLYGKGNETHELGTFLFAHKRNISAVKRVEFVRDRMSYIILRGCWLHIIDDLKDRCYEELERKFDKFPKYHLTVLLGDVSVKAGREGIFKVRNGNESLHEISNDNGVRVVNFATSKNFIVKHTMFPHRNNVLGHLRMGKPTTRFTIF
jgi:hypothetical protein